MKKHVIVFEPSGLRISVEEPSTFFDAIRNTGLHVNSECGGKGTCGKCTITLYPVPDPVSQDLEYISSSNLDLKNRLACQHIVTQDTQVVLSDHRRNTKILTEGVSIKEHWKLDPGLDGKIGVAFDI